MPNVTIVIPVYNEGDNIRKTLSELDDKVSVEAETWLVYDWEDDSTLPPAKTLERKTRIPFRLVRNKYGKGALNAIKTGLEDAETELIVVTMADLCDPPEVINELVAAANRDAADIVCASRYMKGGKQYGGPKFKGFLSHTAGLLLCWLQIKSFHLGTETPPALQMESPASWEEQEETSPPRHSPSPSCRVRLVCWLLLMPHRPLPLALSFTPCKAVPCRAAFQKSTSNKCWRGCGHFSTLAWRVPWTV